MVSARISAHTISTNQLGTNGVQIAISSMLNWTHKRIMGLSIMAFPVVEYSRQGYKIRKVFG